MTTVVKFDNLPNLVGQKVESIGGNLPFEITAEISRNVNYMIHSQKVNQLSEEQIKQTALKILNMAYLETGNKVPEDESEYFVILSSICDDLVCHFTQLTANEIVNCVRKGIRSEDFRGVTAVNIFKILDAYKKSTLRAESLILIEKMKQKPLTTPKIDHKSTFDSFKNQLVELQQNIEKNHESVQLMPIPYTVFYGFLEKCKVEMANVEEKKRAYAQALKKLKQENRFSSKKLMDKNIYEAQLDTQPSHPDVVALAKKLVLEDFLEALSLLDKSIAEYLNETALNHYLNACQNEPQ